MSNIPKMGQLPTPLQRILAPRWPVKMMRFMQQTEPAMGSHGGTQLFELPYH
jgi:hypothetical protein